MVSDNLAIFGRLHNFSSWTAQNLLGYMVRVYTVSSFFLLRTAVRKTNLQTNANMLYEYSLRILCSDFVRVVFS